jgi:hypothetical protein
MMAMLDCTLPRCHWLSSAGSPEKASSEGKYQVFVIISNRLRILEKEGMDRK